MNTPLMVNLQTNDYFFFSPADATMPREEKVEEQDELSKERLNLYVEDDVPSTPLSETGTATPEERAQAEIDTFSLKFGEEIKEDKPTEEATDEKEDDGKEKGMLH
jgi:hypothetical protein